VGGALWHGQSKIVCLIHRDCNMLTKFHDFVSFNVRNVLEKLFWNFNLYYKNVENHQKYPKGHFYAKIKNLEKITSTFRKKKFSYLSMYCTCSELSFEVYNLPVYKNQKCLLFLSILTDFVYLSVATKMHYTSSYIL
jgi:hypothetical protein